METPSSDAKPSHLAPLLIEAVSKEQAFLHKVDDLADVLYDEDVVRVASLRYERLWIPAVAASFRQGSSVPTPPLDVAFIWHCHALCPTRYFSDWGRVAGSVPDFVFPGPPTILPDGSPPGLHADVDLSTRAAALESMWTSLGERVSAGGAVEHARALAAQPLSELVYDVAAAALRQRVFYYQVSLPHYQHDGFIRAAVDRYITFLTIMKKAGPGVKLCPTYDIDLVWHSHMSLPHRYKADTEAILGRHLPHDDSINDRSAGAELQQLQQQTEGLFEEAGAQFFQAGGMFRGIPSRLTPQQRSDCLPDAPPTSVLVTLKGYHWAAAGSSSSGGGDAGQALHPDAVIAAWGLAKPSKLPAALSRGSKVMQPATEALEVAYAAEAKLSIVVEQGAGAGKTCTASAKFCADALLKAACGRGDGAAAAAAVVVEVPVKLGGKAGRCVAALTLSLAPRFRAVLCGPAEPVKADQHPSAVDAEHESAAAVVSQPELLLPTDAVHGEGADAAETRSFLVPVRGSEAKGGFSGQPMLARVTNSSRHLASAVEVFADAVDPSDPASANPAATAHSVNLATLASWGMCPWQKHEEAGRIVAGSKSQYIDCGTLGEAGSALDVDAGMRAFLIRSGDKDWGLLYGWWSAEDRPESFACWSPQIQVHVFKPGGAGSGPEATGSKGSSGPRLELFCDGGALFEFHAGEGPAAAKQAGRLAAVAATIALCRSLLLVMTAPLPFNRPVPKPQDVSAALGTAWPPLAPLRNGKMGSIRAARRCTHLPTNGYISKRLYFQQSRDGGSVRVCTAALPWYGSAEKAAGYTAGPVFWGGPGCGASDMAGLWAAWEDVARRDPGGSSGGGGGGCAGACGVRDSNGGGSRRAGFMFAGGVCGGAGCGGDGGCGGCGGG